MSASKRALVTGAAGFLGSHIVDKLRERGVKARVLVRPSGTEPKLKIYVDLSVPLQSGETIAARQEQALAEGARDHQLHPLDVPRRRRPELGEDRLEALDHRDVEAAGGVALDRVRERAEEDLPQPSDDRLAANRVVAEQRPHEALGVLEALAPGGPAQRRELGRDHGIASRDSRVERLGVGPEVGDEAGCR